MPVAGGDRIFRGHPRPADKRHIPQGEIIGGIRPVEAAGRAERDAREDRPQRPEPRDPAEHNEVKYVADDKKAVIQVPGFRIQERIGAGLQSVAVPGLVARLMNGTGRVNVGQGAVMAVQGIGASLSPAIGGWLAQLIGYPTTFVILGSLSLVSLVLWIAFASFLKPACAGAPVPVRSPAPA